MLITSKNLIRDHVVQFYYHLFSSEDTWCPDISEDVLPRLSPEASSSLSTIFTEEELKETIFRLTGDSTPSPDGCPMFFFQKCWEIVRNDALAAILKFHASQAHLEGNNRTFLVHLPKKAGTCSLLDYRPINLLNGVYKIIIKMIANRLSVVMDKLVSWNQSAFIRSTQIHKNFLTAH